MLKHHIIELNIAYKLVYDSI